MNERQSSAAEFADASKVSSSNTVSGGAAVTPETSLKSVRRDLYGRILDSAERGETALSNKVMFLDLAAYLSEEIFQKEFEILFRNTPQVACLSSDLPEPGSFRLFEELGVPIIVTRGLDGKVRAFLNICPHRGAKIVREEFGKSSRHTCRFHGWTFSADGGVIGLPEEPMFCSQIDQRKSLEEFPVEERHGFVFVQATAGSEMDLDKFLGEFGPELEILNLKHAHRVDSMDVHSPSNWKYALDTYFENYHLPSLHRDSFAKIFESGLCLFDTWGPHHRFTFPHRGVRDWIGRPESEWPSDALPITYFLFPNTIISVGSVSKIGGSLTVNRLYPQSVGKNLTRIVACAQNGVPTPEHVAEIEKSMRLIAGAVVDEDYSVTGEAYDSLKELPEGWEFVYGKHEIGVQNLHRNFSKYTRLYSPRFKDTDC